MLTLEKAKEFYEYHLKLRPAASIIEKVFSETEFNKRKHNNVVAYYIVREINGDLTKYDLVYQQNIEDSNLDYLHCYGNVIKKWVYAKFQSYNNSDNKKLKEKWKSEEQDTIYVNGLFDTISKSTAPISTDLIRSPKQINEDLRKALQKLIDATSYAPCVICDTVWSNNGNTGNFHFEVPKTNFYSFDFTIPLPDNPKEALNDLKTNSKEIKEETITPEVCYRETCNRYWASEDAKWSELESWSKKF